jgi:hypothetical protein
VDFSEVVLAVAAASKAFLEASCSASRDDMRALAADKASAAQEGKSKSSKETEKSTQDRQNIGKKVTLKSPKRQTSSARSVQKKT